MGAIVYCSDGKKVGKLRFIIAYDKPPFQLYKIVVEHIIPEMPDLLVPAEFVSEHAAQTIHLTITSDEFAQCEQFASGDWFGGYQQNPQQHSNKYNNNRHTPSPRRPNRQPISGSRMNRNQSNRSGRL